MAGLISKKNSKGMLLKLLLEMFFHMLRMWPYVSLHALKLHTWSIRFTRIG